MLGKIEQCRLLQGTQKAAALNNHVAERLGKIGVEVGRGQRIKVDRDTMATSLEGVFAGGDAVTGPASVVPRSGRTPSCGRSSRRGRRGEAIPTGFRKKVLTATLHKHILGETACGEGADE